MKIKAAVCTTDILYSERITHYFQAHYYDKFEWNVCTRKAYLKEFLEEHKDAELVLVGREMLDEAELELLKENSGKGWACLTDEIDESLPEEINQLEKYCRADKIYRDLLELYSRQANIHYHNAAITNDKTEIYAFVSAAGGTGTSTVAAAMAHNYARFERVLYINLENIGGSQLVFAEEGKKGMDEIMIALSSRRKALTLKIAGSVSRDKSGVYFFEEGSNALDIMNLTQENIRELLETIRQMREYDKVILDVGNGLGVKELAAMMYASRIVVVTEDTEIAEKKLVKYIETLQMAEMQKQTDICSKMVLFYNKVFRQVQLPQQQCQIRIAGSFPQIENGNYEGIIRRLAQLEVIHNVK